MRTLEHTVTTEKPLEETALAIDRKSLKAFMGGTMRNGMWIIAIGLLLGAVAVDPAQAITTIGVRAGVSIATASLDAQENFDADNRTGFTGTLFLDSGLGFLNFQPEVSYIQKGAKSATTGAEIALDYVELAALLKVGLPIPVVQPHVFVGIGADINTDTSIHFENSTLTTKNMDWTVPLGADIRLAFGKVGVYADARYAVGLTNVVEGEALFTDLKNRAWILSAGVGYEF